MDTPIWSLALRRRTADLNPRERFLSTALQELISDGHAELVGPVRQELLSGLRHETSFKKLRDQLRAFEEPPLDIADYEEAARIHNQCRSKGIAGSAVDFLICATASRRDWEIFTTDRDFTRYAAAAHLKLYHVR
ncbi:MAG: PIN domain-containing protein [Candidatus Sulfotelmatobacter sp.]